MWSDLLFHFVNPYVNTLFGSLGVDCLTFLSPVCKVTTAKSPKEKKPKHYLFSWCAHVTPSECKSLLGYGKAATLFILPLWKDWSKEHNCAWLYLALMTALRSGCLLFYWIQKLWALQSIKPSEALVCAWFISYYVPCYHNMFCALMAAFLCQSFGKSALYLYLSLFLFFKYFFSLKPCWRVLRIRKIWPCWECMSFHPWERTNPSCVQLSSQHSQCTGAEGLKDIHVPWLILPSCCGQAAFLATNKVLKRSVE